MLAALIAVGVFSSQRYDTPPARTLLLPGINVNHAPCPTPFIPPKLADEKVDFRLDWSRSLLGDVIVAATVQAISGDVIPSRVIFDDGTSSFFVAGGTTGTTTALRCKVTTAVGRIFEFVLPITVS